MHNRGDIMYMMYILRMYMMHMLRSEGGGKGLPPAERLVLRGKASTCRAHDIRG